MSRTRIPEKRPKKQRHRMEKDRKTEQRLSAEARAVTGDGNKNESWHMEHPKYPEGDNYETIDLTETREYPVPDGRPVRVYCDGVYDMFHYGHARQLMQAKTLFSNVYLLVGVCSDALTATRKGDTVMTERERYESVRHCRYVDEVIEDAPWELSEEFLTRHAIDYVAHDAQPYAAGDVDDIYAFLKQSGRFIPTKRTVNISTTGLITRIVRNYDFFLRRQLLRGISREDLNISTLKEVQLWVLQKLQSELDDLKTNLRIKQERIKDRVMEEIREITANITRHKENIATRLNTEIQDLKNDFMVMLSSWEGLSNLWLKNFLERFESMREGWVDRILGLVKKHTARA